jgi:hypothetical protein
MLIVFVGMNMCSRSLKRVAIRSYIKSKSKTREGIGDLHIDPEDTNSEKREDNKKKANILFFKFWRSFKTISLLITRSFSSY